MRSRTAGGPNGGPLASSSSTSRRRKMDEKYERLGKVGEGAYGVVFRARDRDTGEVVALKKIRYDTHGDESAEGTPATALREITVLKKMKSVNVIGLKDVVLEEKRLYLVFDFLDQDLKAYMDTIGPEGMDPKILMSFSRQLLVGLAECHARLVLHRDLKPQNLLIDSRGNLKLADFGLARTFKTPIHKYTHEVVTLWYRAPEILLGSDHYCTAVDLWAAACIIAEMSNLTPLFPGDSEIDQLFKVFQVLGTPNEKTWEGVSKFPDYCFEFPKWRPRDMNTVVPRLNENGVNLIRGLLQYVPSRRLTAKEAMDHPFFTQIETTEEEALVG